MYQEYLNQLQRTISPLSTEELKDLLNDEEKLNEKVDEVLEFLKVQKDSLFADNRTKAEQNIEKEPQIIELRGKVNELTEEAKTCCEVVQGKLGIIKEKSGNVNQETALALLQTSAAESEEASEELIKKFTEKEINVDAFLEEFLAKRKIMHLRKLKAEKMQELIRKQAQGPSYSNMQGTGTPSGFYPMPGGNSIPYPMGPMIPMPSTRPY